MILGLFGGFLLLFPIPRTPKTSPTERLENNDNTANK
jgi:hypothetical protein